MSVTFLTNNDRDELEAKIAEGGSAKEFIFGTKDIDGNFTFSKPSSDMYDIVYNHFDEYTIMFNVDDYGTIYKYIAFMSNGRFSSSDGMYSSATFMNIRDNGRGSMVITSRDLRFYTDGRIVEYAAIYKEIPNLPLPSSDSEMKLVITKDGYYTYVNPSELELPKSSYTLVAMASGGSLMAAWTYNLFEMMSSMMSTLNVVPVLLAVASDTNTTDVSLYTCSKVFNAKDPTNIYAIFTNGIETAIKMDAEGNFTYVDPE